MRRGEAGPPALRPPRARRSDFRTAVHVTRASRIESRSSPSPNTSRPPAASAPTHPPPLLLQPRPRMALLLRLPSPSCAFARAGRLGTPLSFSSGRQWRLPFSRTIQARPVSSLSDGELNPKRPIKQSEIIFLGTGTSEGIPRVSCLTNPLKTCEVCSKATEPGNKNRRHNTSLLIRYAHSMGTFNILIDAGKFFYHSALRWFPHFGLRTIDAVIITHSHADAIGGYTVMKKTHYYLVDTSVIVPGAAVSELQFNIIKEEPFIVHNLKVMKKTHYYLVDTSVVVPGAAVSELQFNIIKEEPFIVHNLKVTPLPVWHGQGYRSLGFRFGNICYISDVSDIPEETYELLQDCDILIMILNVTCIVICKVLLRRLAVDLYFQFLQDALRPDRSSSTHFGLPRVKFSSLKALEEVRKIRPRRTLFTGMMHLMDHHKVNTYLTSLTETEGLDVQLSYDGLRVPVSL
ncbi:hypothetical protein Taro_012684 [Colocasia esculenta]|uniref:Metallo-beta-lactamase domain-containing protein n=1 Tax=Colocasia esculenta TaxID=4460 RepID=A0A843UDN7_COLES|nr:hypothetical protein [Colocasia esculenta]